jgi:DNA repair exonuclease SbcCD ATPase subunit
MVRRTPRDLSNIAELPSPPQISNTGKRRTPTHVLSRKQPAAVSKQPLRNLAPNSLGVVKQVGDNLGKKSKSKLQKAKKRRQNLKKDQREAENVKKRCQSLEQDLREAENAKIGLLKSVQVLENEKGNFHRILDAQKATFDDQISRLEKFQKDHVTGLEFELERVEKQNLEYEQQISKLAEELNWVSAQNGELVHLNQQLALKEIQLYGSGDANWEFKNKEVILDDLLGSRTLYDPLQIQAYTTHGKKNTRKSRNRKNRARKQKSNHPEQKPSHPGHNGKNTSNSGNDGNGDGNPDNIWQCVSSDSSSCV